ncbi:hypothetical protein Pmani_025994 [Petrolisthes manimaculis]|uniref:Uncharacterized protein n=1 Tax=Petrolisthes manimaculis TaxID=1843537 RepID=A0AAE1TYA5_9EUCA|nr:hypothetical protein Pmani_025994 [Petrolisthes manimaculis]
MWAPGEVMFRGDLVRGGVGWGGGLAALVGVSCVEGRDLWQLSVHLVSWPNVILQVCHSSSSQHLIVCTFKSSSRSAFHNFAFLIFSPPSPRVKSPTPPLADTSRFSAFFAHSAPVLRQTGSPDKVMGQWAGPWVPSPLVTAGQGDHGSAKLPHDEPASNTSARNSPQRKQLKKEEEEEEEEEEKGVMTLRQPIHVLLVLLYPTGHITQPCSASQLHPPLHTDQPLGLAGTGVDIIHVAKDNVRENRTIVMKNVTYGKAVGKMAEIMPAN